MQITLGDAAAAAKSIRNRIMPAFELMVCVVISVEQQKRFCAHTLGRPNENRNQTE